MPTCEPHPATIAARWQPNHPDHLHLSWNGFTDHPNGSEYRCLGKESSPARVGSATLDVRLKEPQFYEPAFEAHFSHGQFGLQPLESISKTLRYRLELWSKDEILHEMSEALFSGQKGMLRLLFENDGKRTVQIEAVDVVIKGLRVKRIPVGRHPIAAGTSGEVLIPIQTSANAKPALLNGKLSFRVKGKKKPIQREFQIPLYRLSQSRKSVHLGGGKQPTIDLDMDITVDTPWGFSEQLNWRQRITPHFGNHKFTASTEILEFNALVILPPDLSPALIKQWGQPVSPLLLSNYYSLGDTVREGFGIATGAAAAGFAALGAAAAKAALGSLLGVVLSPLLSPYAFYLVALFLLTAGFETWWSVFIGAAAGMTGREINKVIYDKIGEVLA